LNTDQLRFDGGGNGPALAIADGPTAGGALDLTDRRNDGSCTAGKSLSKRSAFGVCLPLVDRVGLLTHIDASGSKSPIQKFLKRSSILRFAW
jgi:hypothetical protein